jgi:hypothetical protein
VFVPELQKSDHLFEISHEEGHIRCNVQLRHAPNSFLSQGLCLTMEEESVNTTVKSYVIDDISR